MMSAKTNPSNTSTSQCDCPEKKNHHSILYTLLSSGTSSTAAPSASPKTEATEDAQCQPIKPEEEEAGNNQQEAIYPWDCPMRALHTLPTIIRLKHAEEACPYAAQLLIKTVDFIRNLPAVLCLSRSDRVRLLQHCWSELLILTMAQCQFHIQVEKVSFHKDSQDNNNVNTGVNSKPASSAMSIAKSCSEKDCREGALLKYIIATQGIPTTSDIDTLNAFFQKCQTLQIDDKEFAYLKSTIFFNPGKKKNAFK
ncbi:nuclear receptor subfamily 0 group B member 1-like [Strongylocentrotus purpuratus]|uniref:NR LBD domain-containing protein n=1 Tax=Strongylocentrotus purpuratus TaxID=7668 RepID=A0A7M7MYJ7_STRPU|nr:nuclear receptor subfamily 0 group B member 1-like [Strongylocentrotus purpuratus]